MTVTLNKKTKPDPLDQDALEVLANLARHLNTIRIRLISEGWTIEPGKFTPPKTDTEKTI